MFKDKIQIPYGVLEIIVKDVYKNKIIRHDILKNQIQDWARHALAYLQAGRLFSTYGNHGEEVTDIGSPYTIAHYKDGRDGSLSDDIVHSTPWVYNDSFENLIQVRTFGGDVEDGSTLDGTPLYPFFPTKMRFGTGGLDLNQQPRTDIPTNATNLQQVQPSFPFVLVERNRPTTGSSSHINLSSSINVNNIVTFSCKLPAGDSSYPYNNLVISEVGLFSDAALIVDGNTDMRTGLMFAYRSFFGISKNESIEVTFSWSFRY